MTSHLLSKTRCPKCAERGKDKHADNLGIYSDGHHHCFSCGYTSNASTEARLRPQVKQQQAMPALPEDTDTWLPPEAMDWLHQYFNDTADFPLCYWSESNRWLIFPIMDKDMTHMLAWQYRYFGTNERHPKWKSYGISENLLHILGTNIFNTSNHHATSSLVLVEDLLSAVKVGHITPTLCLFGSNISLKRLAVLKTLGYTNIIIWLDWDKRDYAIKTAQQAQTLGLQTRVIHTQLDPKEYSYEDIQQCLKSVT